MTLQPCNLSCDSNYYLNWQTLAPPPISMQKLTHTRLRALPPPPLPPPKRVTPRLTKVTCAWSCRLFVINPAIRMDSTNCTAPLRFSSHYSLYRFCILTIQFSCNFEACDYNRSHLEFNTHKIRIRSKSRCLTSVSSSKSGWSLGPFILWLLSGQIPLSSFHQLHSTLQYC